MTKSKEFVSSVVAGGMLGFSPDHVRRLILQGKLKAQKIGRDWVINVNDLKDISRRRINNKEKETRLDGNSE